jgi:hypothetical protein
MSSFSGVFLCPLTTISHLMHLLFSVLVLPYGVYFWPPGFIFQNSSLSDQTFMHWNVNAINTQSLTCFGTYWVLSTRSPVSEFLRSACHSVFMFCIRYRNNGDDKPTRGLCLTLAMPLCHAANIDTRRCVTINEQLCWRVLSVVLNGVVL